MVEIPNIISCRVAYSPITIESDSVHAELNTVSYDRRRSVLRSVVRELSAENPTKIRKKFKILQRRNEASSTLGPWEENAQIQILYHLRRVRFRGRSILSVGSKSQKRQKFSRQTQFTHYRQY